MKFELSEVVQWAWLGAIAVGSALYREVRSLRANDAETEGKLSVLRTHVAEKYVTKAELKDDFERVYSTLDRIEKKLDERRP